MKTICLYFQIHQPLRLNRYRFFNIGHHDYYYDDATNERIMRRVAKQCYLPANRLIMQLIKKHQGKFKVSFSISGTALDQFAVYAPEVIKSFRDLADTGCVEFLAETYSHSLAALTDESECQKQVTKHSDKMLELFGQQPRVFRNTELIYSDEIGAMVAKMGFEAVLTEGSKEILGWRSPNFLYCNPLTPKLNVLLKNHTLSDDIAHRFSDFNWNEWPLTAEKYVSWLNKDEKDEQIINLFMNYETFGEHHKKENGIFRFLDSFPGAVLEHSDFQFKTPYEVTLHHDPIADVRIPSPVSWAGEKVGVATWLGNGLQKEAFSQLYALKSKLQGINDPKLLLDWQYLQTSDHFYYMSTKQSSNGDNYAHFNPYQDSYDAFMNYMNILNDFAIRINKAVKVNERPVKTRKTRFKPEAAIEV